MSECAASLRDWRSSPLFMRKQKRPRLYEEAEVYPAGRKKSRSLLHQGLALAEEEGLLWPLLL